MSETQFPIITICGSMRFYPEMLAVAEKLTSDGWIVLMSFANKTELKGISQEQVKKLEEMLDDMHRTKINMSERICVVTSGNAASFYIGKSTEGEISYANEKGIDVYFWTQHFRMVKK